MKVYRDKRIEDNGEAFDKMFKEFKRRVKDDGILAECRKREFFMSKIKKRKEKDKQAALRKKKKSRRR